MKYKIELLSSIKNTLGEGPFFDFESKAISWIDILSKKLYIKNGDNIKEIVFKEKIGAAVPCYDFNKFIVCGETKLYLYQNDKIEEYIDISGIVKKGMRCNDAKFDSRGRLFFSTMVDDGVSKPDGALYKLEGKKITKVMDTLLGNGLAWSIDSKKFYFADSIAHKIYSFDYDIESGTLSNKKILIETSDTPDGMTIDNKNNLYIAIWGGAKVEVRSGVDGTLIDIINLPTKLITSATFINDSYNELVITSASLDEKDESAGKVFKVRIEE